MPIILDAFEKIFRIKKNRMTNWFFFASLRLFFRDHLHAKETNHKKKPHAHTLFKICWREFHLYVEELFALFDNRWSIKKYSRDIQLWVNKKQD